MQWRIMLELAGPDGTPQMHEVGAGERSPTGHAAAALGLSLEQGKAVLAVVQRHLVAAQVDEHCRRRRPRARRGGRWVGAGSGAGRSGRWCGAISSRRRWTSTAAAGAAANDAGRSAR